MSVEGKVHVKMRASVGTLRSQGTYWIEPDRAAVLVERRFADIVAEEELAPVDVIGAIEETAQLMRDRHKLQPEQEAADGQESDPGKSAPRSRKRPGNGNGASDPAGRLDKPPNGEPG